MGRILPLLVSDVDSAMKQAEYFGFEGFFDALTEIKEQLLVAQTYPKLSDSNEMNVSELETDQFHVEDCRP